LFCKKAWQICKNNYYNLTLILRVAKTQNLLKVEDRAMTTVGIIVFSLFLVISRPGGWGLSELKPKIEVAVALGLLLPGFWIAISLLLSMIPRSYGINVSEATSTILFFILVFLTVFVLISKMKKWRLCLCILPGGTRRAVSCWNLQKRLTNL